MVRSTRKVEKRCKRQEIKCYFRTKSAKWSRFAKSLPMMLWWKTQTMRLWRFCCCCRNSAVFLPRRPKFAKPHFLQKPCTPRSAAIFCTLQKDAAAGRRGGPSRPNSAFLGRESPNDKSFSVSYKEIVGSNDRKA